MQKRKILFLIIIIITSLLKPVYATDKIIESQKEELNIPNFLKEAKKYTEDAFPDIEPNELLDSAMNGSVNNSGIIKQIFSLIGPEIINTFRILGSVLIIIVIHSILKSISENLENESVSKITYYVQYILIVTIILSNFTQIINMVKESVSNLVGFMNTLIPILITLMATTGSIASATLVQPIVLFIIIFIGNIINLLIIPILLIATVLSIISNLSEKVQIDKLAKFFKTGIVWFLGLVITVFVGILSLEGTLTSSVDGFTAKTAKAAVSNFIPVVGKALGDATDAVLGCASLLKNAVGIVGVIMVIGVVILPIIKLAILTITYHLSAALCEPIADKSIIKLLEQIGDSFKILLGIICFMAVMLIAGITIVVNISNSGMMYR